MGATVDDGVSAVPLFCGKRGVGGAEGLVAGLSGTGCPTYKKTRAVGGATVLVRVAIGCGDLNWGTLTPALSSSTGLAAGRRARGIYQPMTMLDSMTLRARSRSEPVSCM